MKTKEPLSGRMRKMNQEGRSNGRKDRCLIEDDEMKKSTNFSQSASHAYALTEMCTSAYVAV